MSENFDFLSKATKEKLGEYQKTDYVSFANLKSNVREIQDMENFKQYFLRLPKEFQEGLIEEAKKLIDEEDKKEDELKRKQSEQIVKTAPIMSNQKALDMKQRLRNKLLKKKGLIK